MTLAITIFTALANLFLGAAIFLRNIKSATHRLFGIYAVLVAAWAVANYFSLSTAGTSEEILMRIRIVLFATALMFPALYMLAVVFPRDDFKKSDSFKIMAAAGFMLASSVLSLTPLVFRSVQLNNGVIAPVAGPGIFLFALNVLGFPVLAFITLYKKYRQAIGRIKIQIAMFMWGIAATFALTTITNFILVNAFHFTQLVVLGPFFTLILVGFVAYAIAKHRFLDVRLLILRSVSFAVFLGLITAFFMAVAGLVIHYLLPGGNLSDPAFLIFLGFSFFVGLASPVFAPWIERRVGKLFFRGIYVPEELLDRLLRIMASEADFDELAPKLLDVLVDELFITKAAILIIEGRQIVDMKGRGFHDHTLFKAKSFEDIMREPELKQATMLEEVQDENVKELLRELDIELIIPVRIENREVAILLFGPKAAGNVYTNQDLSVLNIFAQQVGATLQNARKFKNLRIIDNIKDEFMRTVSHQFRTPLAEARWRLESILGPEYTGDLKDTLREPMTEIYFSVRWLSESLDKILLAFELEAKDFQIHMNQVDAATFLTEEVLRPFHDLAALKKTSINFQLPPEPLPPLFIDAEKMKEALRIVLDNSIKYADESRPIEVTVKVRTAPGNKKIMRIEFRNHGSPIPEKDKSMIFFRFFRGETARTMVPNGLGLGLFISRSVIELHGGKIWFESDKKGTTFFVEIPSS